MTQCRHLYNEFAWNCFMTSVEKRNLMKDNAIVKKKKTQTPEHCRQLSPSETCCSKGGGGGGGTKQRLVCACRCCLCVTVLVNKFEQQL